MAHEKAYLVCEDKCLVESRPVMTGSVTLSVAGWSSKSQTVSVTGVTANCTVVVSPAPSNLAECANCKVICSAQGAGTLTFTCDTVPENAIVMNVVRVM